MLHDLGVRVRAARNYPPLARDWAIPWIKIPMWTVVKDGPAAAQLGDIVSERILYWDASGHAGIVVGPGQTVSADSTASPPGRITVTDYGSVPITMDASTATRKTAPFDDSLVWARHSGVHDSRVTRGWDYRCNLPRHSFYVHSRRQKRSAVSIAKGPFSGPFLSVTHLRPADCSFQAIWGSFIPCPHSTLTPESTPAPTQSRRASGSSTAFISLGSSSAAQHAPVTRRYSQPRDPRTALTSE